MKRTQLFQWIASVYAGRMIRVSGGPYLHHLIAVADMTDAALPFGYEIGLCHDLLEDTGMTAGEFIRALENLGYGGHDAASICQVVRELTDVYTKAAFPGLSKKERRRKEEERLKSASGPAQTVKYADLIYNSRWTKENQPEKLPAYLARKKQLLEQLDKGDPALRAKAMMVLNSL